MKNTIFNQIKYPLHYKELGTIDKVLLNTKIIVKCPICGKTTKMLNIRTDLQIREFCNCNNCSSQNRQRQLAYMMLQGTEYKSLKELANKSKIHIYNTESRGALHDSLSNAENYICSEYFGAEYRGGDIVNGQRHEDLQKLSFKDNCLDIVISSDVFEHIPNPYRAHEEIFRVLRKGGKHIFTVPFYQESFCDEKRAEIDEEGSIKHIKEPLYHLDPLTNGILVYNIFSLEMLVKLSQIGFMTRMYQLRVPSAGIYGKNAVVFEAIKI